MTAEQVKASILQFAIQGNLVPQDPNDEPASELLKRIEAAKDAKSAKKGKPLPPITDDEKPFPIPDSWEWVRLGEVGVWGAGATPQKSILKYYEGGTVPWLLTGDLNDGLITQIPNRITDIALKETSVKLNPKGSVLIAMYGATIGKVGVLNFDATTNQACCACDPSSIIDRWYLFYFLMAWRAVFRKRGEGGAQPNISKEKIVATVIPLPPLTEQKRIVAKVEALFKYVDECEDSRKELAEKLAETLKSSILQEAIQGRLVPQDPNDEPASELLKRIKAAKNAKIAKKAKPLPPITDDEKPFQIPSSWEWVRLGDVSRVISKGTTPMGGDAAYSSEGAFFVRAENICDNGVVNIQNCKRLKIAVHTKELSRSILEEGDLLISIAGSLGKIGLITSDILPANINQAIAFVRICDRTLLYDRYMVLLLKATAIQNVLLSQKKVTGVPNLTLEIITNLPFPLPPLAEQKRIVAKVDSLLKGVGTLKNLYEVDAWVLNLRIKNHKKLLCEKYDCLDIRFEAHEQDVPLQHPCSCAYMEVVYRRDKEVDAEALRKEIEEIINFSLSCTTVNGGISDEQRNRRMIFKVE